MAVRRGNGPTDQGDQGRYDTGHYDQGGHDSDRYDSDRHDSDGHDSGRHVAGDEGRYERGSERDRAVSPGYSEAEQRDRYGGINWGAGFFGWLVAIAVSILLSSIVGAIATGVGASTNVTQTTAQQQAGTIGIVAGIVLLVVLLIGYYTGGYVAGRMSRFDGGKQGLAVWVIGLVVTILAVILGAAFGAQYNILQRVSLPSIPVSPEAMSWGGIIAAVAIVLGTLLAAMLGGKVGHRYHNKVDRAGYR